MEIFISGQIDGNILTLSEEESKHCIRVLRHRKGDMIDVADGRGTLYRCRLLSDSPSAATAEIMEKHEGWGGHPYELTMAVCPTKNMDRYEWFAEKACEIGVDRIVPVMGEHSERRIFKPARIERILVSAMKQSLKSRCPEVADTVSVKDFIRLSAQEDNAGLKLMAYCFEDEDHPRISIREALQSAPSGCNKITVLIGPEGDFSKEEAAFAMENGFIPVHLGPSRLRTETAALTAVACVYERFVL